MLIRFHLPAPVLIGAVPLEGKPDERVPYSLADMVRHFQRRAPAYNETMGGARCAARTLLAIENADADGVVELEQSDCRVLKALIESPGPCGWIDARARRVITTKAADGTPQQSRVLQRIEIPAVTFIALADAVPSVGAEAT
jgi:hypothetical protein